ncbi:hypothetical protein MMC10_010480 [Thelotrema lepadinum]|nr:hypothetical protein [Thelotrema lepadinum]
MATLVVGKEERPIHLEKSTICAKSAFLDTALKSAVKEGWHSTITLPEENPKIVRYLAKWMGNYDGDLAFPPGIQWPIEELLELFSLAEKWKIREYELKLKDGLYSLIKLHVANLSTTTQCRQAWEIVRDSEIRYLVIDSYIQVLRNLAHDNTAIPRHLLRGEDPELMKDAFICQELYGVSQDSDWPKTWKDYISRQYWKD